MEKRKRNGGRKMLQVSYPDVKEGKNLPLYVKSVGVDYAEEMEVRRGTGDGLFLFSEEGAGEAVIEGIVYDLPAGSGIYLNGRTRCEFRPCGDWKISWVTFGVGIPACGDMMFLGRDWCLFDLNRREEHRELLYGIYDASALDAVWGEGRASAMLYCLCTFLDGVLRGIAPRTSPQNPVMDAIIEYIDENYTDDITLEQLCRAAGGLSEQYLCRFFKQNTGMRPMEYMLRRRIDAARTFLERSDMSIAEIARASGFRNTSYFYRNFRKFTGMSPLAYRQSVLGGC